METRSETFDPHHGRTGHSIRVVERTKFFYGLKSCIGIAVFVVFGLAAFEAAYETVFLVVWCCCPDG